MAHRLPIGQIGSPFLQRKGRVSLEVTSDMNAFDLLRRDHQQASTLIQSLFDSDDPIEQEAIFEELMRDLESHARIEEEHFYPAVRRETGLLEEVIGSRVDHEQMRDLLEAMQDQAIGAQEWWDALEDLRELVEQHTEEEEDELFPAVQEVLSDEALQQLGEEMEQERRALIE